MRLGFVLLLLALLTLIFSAKVNVEDINGSEDDSDDGVQEQPLTDAEKKRIDTLLDHIQVLMQDDNKK